MRWPKEEGTDFAGHEMAKGGFAGHRMTKKSAPQHGQREPHPSLATHWPKKPPDRPLATNSPTLTDWGQRVGGLATYGQKGGGSLSRC